MDRTLTGRTVGFSTLERLEAIVANRVPGIRCVIGWDLSSARFGRAHNDANMLSLGQRMLALEEALEIVEVWLETPFEGGRHAIRIAQIDSGSGVHGPG